MAIYSGMKPAVMQAKIREVLTSEASFATTLITLLVDLYGTELFEWTPQNIREQLEKDFSVVLPPGTLDRIVAAMFLITSDEFYHDAKTFNHVCAMLTGEELQAAYEPVDVDECCWAVAEALILAPPEANGRQEEPFSDEIRYYIGQLLQREGFLKPPGILGIAAFDNPPEPADFSDDTEMFSMLWQNQASLTTDIDNMMLEGFGALVKQLEALPLQHGNTAQIAKRIGDQMRTIRQELESDAQPA